MGVGTDTKIAELGRTHCEISMAKFGFLVICLLSSTRELFWNRCSGNVERLCIRGLTCRGVSIAQLLYVLMQTLSSVSPTEQSQKCRFLGITSEACRGVPR